MKLIDILKEVLRESKVITLYPIQEDSDNLPEIFNMSSVTADNLFDDDSITVRWNGFEDPEKSKEYKKEENFLRLPYKNVVFKNSNELNIFLLKDDKPIAYASFDKFNDGFQSKLIGKSKSSDIKGLGIMLYEAVVDKLKVPVYSDLQQSEASKKGIWKKLFEKYPERVVAYNIKTKKTSKISADSESGEFDPKADNYQIYGNKRGAKINTHGEEDPDNQVLDWEPSHTIDPFISPSFPLDKFFHEKHLYLLKLIP